MAEILIIDDDKDICTSMSIMVKRLGHDASCANTLREGLSLLSVNNFDVVFLDVRMPDGNGLEVLPRIEEAPSSPEIIIMTGYGDPHGAELAIKSGAWDYIEKGASTKEITLPLVRALQYREHKITNSANKSIVVLKREQIIGNSSKLTACLDVVAQAAGSNANVLITGETGSGKELFARALHENSQRAKGNFVVVDCAALPDTLVESLLFGHEKGAFTGADQPREGLIRQANGGTLFLDEIGELPLLMQKAFLRVLQEHNFRPVGGQREVTSDFRLVAATNRNLETMVKNGEFREDLWYRLKSFIIEVPPLRERIEDIKELTRYHIDKFCDQYGLSSKAFSPEYIDILTQYDWPGNVRELVNTLERSTLAARFEPTIFPKHLPNEIRIKVAQALVKHSPPPPVNNKPFIAGQSMPKLNEYREAICSEAEKQYLIELMALAENNLNSASSISAISLSRLYALLKKYDISTK
jgi:two-component system NtrC family response regulator